MNSVTEEVNKRQINQHRITFVLLSPNKQFKKTGSKAPHLDFHIAVSIMLYAFIYWKVKYGQV